MTKKTRGTNLSAPAIPALLSREANKELTDAATIPLGAIQDKYTFSLKENLLPAALRNMVIGRITIMITRRRARLCQDMTERRVVNSIFAAKIINKTEITNTVKSSLKLKIVRKFGTEVFAIMMPIIVVASNPDSATSKFEMEKATSTNASAARFTRKSGMLRFLSK